LLHVPAPAQNLLGLVYGLIQQPGYAWNRMFIHPLRDNLCEGVVWNQDAPVFIAAAKSPFGFSTTPTNMNANRQ